MNNNCDITQGPAYITSIDTQNAFTYALNKIHFEKTNAYALSNGGTLTPSTGIVTGGPIEWVPSKLDGSVSYICPANLSCKEGFPKISTKSECNARSKYVHDVPPGYKDGVGSWYLEWDDDAKNCYTGNYPYRNGCDNSFSKGNTRGTGLLLWDDDKHRCLVTQEYCKIYGNDDYTEGDGPVTASGKKSGGVCQLDTGTLIGEAIFGKTIIESLKGNC